jgi:hypothetical protein
MSLLTSLISYWKLDEASGTAIDAHSTNNLTDNNSVGSATGKIGNARSFTAASLQFLSHVSNNFFQAGDIDFTFTAWVKLTSKTNVWPIVAKWDDVAGNNANEYTLFYNSGSDRFVFQVEDSSDVTGTVTANNFGSPSIGTWYFVVVWHDSVNNNINIQVNDGTADTTSWTTGTRTSSANFKIGTWDNPDAGRYLDGLVDEVGFWKRVLTSQERTNLSNVLAYPFPDPVSRQIFLNQAVKAASTY